MKILLVDDHKMMRDGLRALLEREGLEVIGEAATGLESLAMSRRLRPEVVVMDISMPGLNGIETTRRLLADFPSTKVVGLSMNSDRRYVLALFEAGAQAYVLKNSASEELIEALRAVTVGIRYVSAALGSLSLRPASEPPRASQAKAPVRPLSPRENEVLRLIAEGKSSKDIAAELGLAVPTVESHRRQIMDKLDLRTIAALTKYAIRQGLTGVD
ncbi:MAG TPA: response regulator transcription factor [Polyangiaceae bacterium]|nr:response regulator transcription factor [Polyangiaceae bacterium]